MKFGKRLEEQTYKEWKFHYMDYEKLKRALKAPMSGSSKFTDQDEAAFVELLERELEKVASFRHLKGDELDRRVAACEREMDKALKEYPTMEGLLTSPAIVPVGSSAAEAKLAKIRKDVSLVTVETSELSKFTRLNYTGFMKILKKHDKYTSYQLKPMFMVRMNNRPFFKESVEDLVVRLSKIFEGVRQGGVPAQYPSQQLQAKSKFIRKTTKYLVDYDKVDQVKSIILKQIPALVVHSKGANEHNPAVSSVYFDNESFQLYAGRLENNDGDMTYRLRWYGNMDQSTVYIERKTYRNPNISNIIAEKIRIAFDEKNINAFLKGEYTVTKDELRRRLEGDKLSDQELNELVKFAKDVQIAVANQNLKPVLRTFYNRTAFQAPNDPHVRISLDTDITFIREDNEDRIRAGDNWRRRDVGVSWPFDYLPSNDYESFPFAVLEVKVETQEGAQIPMWVQKLVESELVAEVPDFSKFVCGVATVLENRVSMLPLWLADVSKESPLVVASAQKKVLPPMPSQSPVVSSAAASPTRASQTGLGPTSPRTSTFGSSSSPRPNLGKAPMTKTTSTATDEVVVDIQDRLNNETTPLLGGSSSNLTQRGKKSTAAETVAVLPPSPKVTTLQKIFGKPKHESEARMGPNPESRFGAPPPGANPGVVSAVGLKKEELPSKIIQLPVRVEPKVYFANERTFLSWLHFCIVLGGLALGLLNFGNDSVAQISGVAFTGVALLFMVYSLFLFLWRANKIRNRDGSAYDDRVGPTLLVFVLFVVVGLNFYLKFQNGTLAFL